jgi:hypothetical protein
MKKIAFLSILAIASIATAGVSVQVIDIGGAYEVHLVADAAADIVTAIDGGFSGSMAQVLAFGALPTPDLTYAGLADLSADSHFNLLPADMITVNAPAETATTLAATVGIQPAKQALDLNLAQIVALGEVTYAFEVSNGAGQKTLLTGVIPEPATMALMGLGALGLLRRRR